MIICRHGNIVKCLHAFAAQIAMSCIELVACAVALGSLARRCLPYSCPFKFFKKALKIKKTAKITKKHCTFAAV